MSVNGAAVSYGYDADGLLIQAGGLIIARSPSGDDHEKLRTPDRLIRGLFSGVQRQYWARWPTWETIPTTAPRANGFPRFLVIVSTRAEAI